MSNTHAKIHQSITIPDFVANTSASLIVVFSFCFSSYFSYTWLKRKTVNALIGRGFSQM